MITFIGLKNRSAGKIRGKQVADALGGKFYDFSDFYISNPTINKIVIIVRNRPEKDLERALKRAGCIVGYDVLDNPIGDFLFRDISPDFSRYVDDESFDFYITNNRENADELSRHTKKKIFVIPHHSVNFNNERSCDGSKLERVGYLGLDYGNKKQKDIKNICDNLGLEYLCNEGGSKDECVDFLKTLDAGIIFVDEESPGNIIRRYKPNTKLINFQSFGIPSICSEYSSFLEFGDKNYISVKSLQAVNDSLKALLSDRHLRVDLSDRSFSTGSKFHISQIIKDYYFKIFEYFNKKSGS